MQDAEFTKLQSESRRLDGDLADLQSQLEQVRRAAAVKQELSSSGTSCLTCGEGQDNEPAPFGLTGCEEILA